MAENFLGSGGSRFSARTLLAMLLPTERERGPVGSAKSSCRFPWSEGDTWPLLSKPPPMIPRRTRCSPRGCVTLEKGHSKWWRTCPTSSSSDRNCGS